jgi:hypothetical protein
MGHKALISIRPNWSLIIKDKYFKNYYITTIKYVKSFHSNLASIICNQENTLTIICFLFNFGHYYSYSFNGYENRQIYIILFYENNIRLAKIMPLKKKTF